MLRRAASTLAPRLRLACEHGAPPSTSGPYSQTPIGILRSLHARGFTANTPAWKEKDGGDETDGAAGRRKRAEAVAATNVNRFSSPLFSHVELEKDDLERTVPRWANVLFVAAVVGVFGYFAQFAYRNETDRRARIELERHERETRARVAVQSGALRDDARNFAGADQAHDPFEGLSPEEIEKLAAAEREEEGNK
jgi:hypothetical protein